MGYSMVNINDVEGAPGIDGGEEPVAATTRQPVASPDGLTIVAVGARRAHYEARGPF